MARQTSAAQVSMVLNIIFMVIIAAALIVYFTMQQTLPWLAQIMPDAIGACMFALILSISMNKSTPLWLFLGMMAIFFVVAVGSYMYALTYQIQFLIDLAPEFIVGTALGIITSAILGKKVRV